MDAQKLGTIDYGCWRESKGKPVPEAPILRFRSGLKIHCVRGGYGAYRILFPEIYLEECYQPSQEFRIRDNFTVIDLGANIGLFTCKAAHAAPNVRVIAVEPIPDLITVLKRNLRSNGLGEQVQVIEAAVWKKRRTEIPIDVWYTASGELKMETPPKWAKKRKTFFVNGLTLEDIFDTARVSRCDFLKVDIEGAEFELFANVPRALWKRIDRISMEIHPTPRTPHQRTCIDLVRKNGFEVFIQENMLWALHGSRRQRRTRHSRAA